MSEIVLVVKVSKFCNLRCAYCYEHRELHMRDVMSVETLAALFAQADALGDDLGRRGIAPSFSFVWHGGEPLLLPPEYYRRIAVMQQESIRRYPYRNSVQTNLYGINKASLEFVLASDWELGVSIDFSDGVRRNVGGRDSNAKVTTNAEALYAGGGRFGVISVLGAHNRNALVDAYDWVAQFAESWRILPIFEGGPQDSVGELQLPPNDVAETFAELFRKRADSDRHLAIAPLDEYTKAAVLRIVDEPDPVDVDREVLDNIFILNVNGDVFTRPFAYDAGHCLGNIGDQTLAQMLDAKAYKSCQRAIVQRKRANCSACEFRGCCDSSPMHEHGSLTLPDGQQRCGVPRASIAAIYAELIDAGVDPTVVSGWAREWLAQPKTAVA